MKKVGMCLARLDGSILGGENYVVINGVTYDLVRRGETKQEKAGEVKLEDVPVGETFKLGQHEMIVLKQKGGIAVVVRKDLLSEESEFGETNNYDGSRVDEICNRWAEEIADVVGAENMVKLTVNLTSDDGLKDYGAVDRRAALLTAEQYRKYIDILDEHNPGKWWWLATPYSTERHGNKSWVKCVASSGFIFSGSCSGGGGVRPFCILKSNIFVSK